VEHAVQGRVAPVVGGVQVEIRVAAVKGRSGAAGTINEIIADDIGAGRSRGIAEDVRVGHPVVDDIVGEFVGAFDLRIAGVVVNVKAAQNTYAAVGLDQPAGRVCFDALGNDGALNGDVRRVGAADGKGFIQPPGNGEMLENHIMAVGDGDGVVVVAIEAHADAEEPG